MRRVKSKVEVMISLDELLDLLQQKQVSVTLRGGALHWDAATEVDADLICALQHHEPQLVELLGAMAPEPVDDKQSLDKQSTDKAWQPLSYTQRGFFYAQAMAPDSAANNMPTAMRIEGKLCSVTLKRVIADIFASHDILRSRYGQNSSQQESWQVVNETVAVIEVSLTDLPLAQAQQNAQQIATNEAARAFDLADSCARVSLITITEQRHLLVLIAHHIVADGWSLRLIHQHIEKRYGEYLNGQQSDDIEPPDAGRYADYIGWQNETAQRHKRQQGQDYWVNKLRNKAQTLCLPAAISTTTPVARGKTIHRVIDKHLIQQLKGTDSGLDISLFNYALAMLAVVLSRFSQQTDFAIGVPMDNRQNNLQRQIVGCFVNTLPILFSGHAGQSLKSAIAEVVTNVNEAIGHSDFEIDQVKRLLGLSADDTSHPIYQVIMTYQGRFNQPFSPIDGLSFKPFLIDNPAFIISKRDDFI